MDAFFQRDEPDTRARLRRLDPNAKANCGLAHGRPGTENDHFAPMDAARAPQCRRHILPSSSLRPIKRAIPALARRGDRCAEADAEDLKIANPEQPAR
jgi:hypothetical protein